jgi:hypothetical protein
MSSKALRCPYCGDSLSPIMGYQGSQYGPATGEWTYMGMECDNYSDLCLAEWDANGNVVREGKS